jgi:hypothetical protein
MEEAEKNLINEINIEEKNFRMEINEEVLTMKNINNEIEKKNSEIKKLKDEKKMDEIAKKNKRRTKSITKYKINVKNTNNMDTQNIRRHSNYKQKQSPNLGINLKNNKVSTTEKRANLHTPNLMKNSEKVTKPFEIKKFSAIIKNNDKSNDEKNNTMFNIYNENKKMKMNSFGDNYSYNDKISVNEKKKKRNKNGVSALKEIESLKCEIQNALKNNIVILNDIDEMRTNYYQREKDEEMFNAYETGKFGKKTTYEEKKEENGNNQKLNDNKNNNNNYKIKKLIQKEQRVQDYQLKQNDNINDDNSKRKPFDKFIFK